MTPNRTIGQTPPDKANELFAQLLDTSNEAVELRGQLLAALRQELDLLASLQEQHLFPVLEQNPETADLVREARDDNRQTKALLDELETTPKDSDAFLAKVTELRRVFQQHIRNDKNELLPVVLKVLSEEEVEAVVEKVEEEIAEVAETRQATPEPRRARRGRKAEGAPDTGGTLLTVVESGSERAQELIQTVQEVVSNDISAASENAARSTGHALELVGRAARDTPKLVNQASEQLQAVVQANRILARGAGTISLEWLGLRQERLLKNLDGLNDLLQCRSMQDVVRVQSSLVRDNLEQVIANSRHLAQLTVQISQEATRTITTKAERDQRAS